jgi:biopolymer transport protein ExbD
MIRRTTRKRRAADDGDLSMTPMIDVVFQLLIFFIVTMEPIPVLSRMDVFRPQDSNIQPEEPPKMVRIMIFQETYTIGIHGDAGDIRVNLKGLESQLARMASVDPSQTISITSAPSADHDRLIQVLNLCGKLGLANLALTTLQ